MDSDSAGIWPRQSGVFNLGMFLVWSHFLRRTGAPFAGFVGKIVWERPHTKMPGGAIRRALCLS